MKKWPEELRTKWPAVSRGLRQPRVMAGAQETFLQYRTQARLCPWTTKEEVTVA